MLILDLLNKGLWEGFSEQESHESMALKTLVAITILFTTPVAPFVAATIPVIGLKRVYDNSLFMGKKLIESCGLRNKESHSIKSKLSS